MKKILLLLIAAFALTGCDDEWWIDVQRQVVDCHHAVDRNWPESSRAWAHRTVERESRNDPTGQNPTSSAAGCFGMTQRHGWRFEATGSSWAFRYDGRANTLAALHLFNEQGTRPWQ